MAQLRIERLFSSLTEKEREALRQDLLKQERSAHLRLFEWLEKCRAERRGVETQKAQAFKILFEKPYSAKQDFLLRNEYRLFSERLETFIAEAQVKTDLNENPYLFSATLLKAYSKRKLWSEFDALYEELEKTVVEACEFDVAKQMDELHALSLIERSELSPEIGKNLAKNIAKSQKNLRRIFSTATARNQSWQAFNEYVLKHYIDVGEARSFSEESDENPLADYFKLKSQMLGEVGTANLQTALNALSLLEKIPNRSKPFLRERVSATGGAGLSCLILRDYIAAATYFEKAIQLSLKADLKTESAWIVNYIAALVKSERVETAIEKIEQYAPLLENYPRLKIRIELLHAFAHLLCGEPKKALTLLPKRVSKKTENIYHHIRFAEIIALCLRGKTEDALRETTNFLRRFTREKDTIWSKHEKEIALLFIKFFKAKLEHKEKKQTRLFRLMKSQIFKMVELYPPYQDSLPMLWLRRELSKLTEG